MRTFSILFTVLSKLTNTMSHMPCNFLVSRVLGKLMTTERRQYLKLYQILIKCNFYYVIQITYHVWKYTAPTVLL